jgi:hypothetical protein
MSPIRFTFALLAAVALALLRAQPVIAHGAEAQPLLAQAERVAPSSQPVETLTGVVHELIVDDATRGTSNRYVELELENGELVPLHGGPSATLTAATRVEVSGQHDGKRLDVMAARVLAAAADASGTKADAEIEGTFALLHADDFAAGKSSFVYEVHQSSGKVTRLRLGALPAALAPGARLRVVGRAGADGESMTPDRITILAQPTSSVTAGTAIAKAATANSVLVIMANFSNTAAPAFTSAQAQQVMTSNADSVANFFRETSYGQQLMNVTVTPGWVDMASPQPATCGSSDWQNIGASAETAAKALGGAYDAAAYGFVVYVFPSVPACGWVGLAYIGNPHKAWINGVSSFRTAAIAHEMGHNFGLLHAASLRCNGIIGGSCSASEYGDPFDAMGNQRAMHYNAMQKSKLGWIASTSVKTHGGGSATYTLTPLETAGAATYAVKIPTSLLDRTYWLEFRQPIGFDSPLSAFPNNGAQIRVASPFETLCGGCDDWSDDTELLDMTPTTSSFTDAALLAGQTFTDPTLGVTVTVVSASASAMTIQVATGGIATPTSTSTALSGSPNPSQAGDAVTFSATVTGSAPTGSVQFTDNGTAIAGCSGVALTGSGDTRFAGCTTSALASGNHAISASYSGDAANAASTSAVYAQLVNAPSGSVNVALATNGATVSASSTYSSAYPVSAVIDDNRTGYPWSAGGGWNDGTPGSYPDWVQINFNGTKTIDHIVVFTLQDNYGNPSEPTDTMQFSLYGITAFTVQGWNGSNWVTLGSVSNNNLVKRTISFSPYATDRIRVNVTSALNNWSRITEIEAWTSSATATTNYALASNGGIASASSTYGAAYPVTAINDNDDTGAGWSAGGGWNDGTSGTFPDWAQVTFNGQKTIDHVVVYTLQDNYGNPVQPTDTMTFSLYGITAFQVQGWNGSSWVTLGIVSGNNLVKRTVSFSPFATDRIRIFVTSALAGWSRIVEVEAWGG